MKQIYELVGRAAGGETFVAMMSDLDHLKQINDIFGHSEGDYAIRTAALILKEAMPESSALGRTGGDEYSGIFIEAREFSESEFKKQVEELCEKENQKNGKPYLIRLSVGCHRFSLTETTDLIQNLKKADEELYLAKQSRPASILKNAQAL